MSVVVLLDADFDDFEIERSMLGAAGYELVAVEDSPSPDEVEGLLMMWRAVDAGEMDRWPRLRVVGRFGLGVDLIDLAAAAARGVRVVNSGEYSTEEVTTQALALALALLRQVVPNHRAAGAGRWIHDLDASRMARVSELTVGVVGLGRIGRRVGRTWATAFGCDVVGYDPYATLGPDDPIRQQASLDSVLAAADLVTLHSPLTEETRHLIGAAQLERMRPSALLVNVARGGLVDQDALVAALESGTIAGAALDVFEREPIAAEEPIAARDDVVLSPHVGYLSPQALDQARRQTVEDVVAVLTGHEPVHTLGL